MSRTRTQGAYCPTTGAIVPVTFPLGSRSGTCDWCGKTHKVQFEWSSSDLKWKEEVKR